MFVLYNLLSMCHLIYCYRDNDSAEELVFEEDEFGFELVEEDETDIDVLKGGISLVKQETAEDVMHDKNAWLETTNKRLE